MPRKRMITTTRLAKLLGVSVATVFAWVKRGFILSGTRIGRSRVWTDSEAKAVADRVATVRGLWKRHPPIRTAHGDDVVWACPFCKFLASRSAPVQTHMRGCVKVWGADAYRGSTPDSSKVRPTPLLSRKALADFALSVIDGEADMDALAAKVQARLDRVKALEDELRALR